ncbi:MAG: tetratricopeptide repeat protein [Promethearchaeota archaeon]
MFGKNELSGVHLMSFTPPTKAKKKTFTMKIQYKVPKHPNPDMVPSILGLARKIPFVVIMEISTNETFLSRLAELLDRDLHVAPNVPRERCLVCDDLLYPAYSSPGEGPVGEPTGETCPTCLLKLAGDFAVMDQVVNTPKQIMPELSDGYRLLLSDLDENLTIAEILNDQLAEYAFLYVKGALLSQVESSREEGLALLEEEVFPWVRDNPDNEHVPAELYSRVVYQLGRGFTDVGDYDKALQYMQSSYAIDEKDGDERNMALSLNRLAEILVHLGRYGEALQSGERALDLMKKWNFARLSQLHCVQGILKAILGLGYKTIEEMPANLLEKIVSVLSHTVGFAASFRRMSPEELLDDLSRKLKM